MLWARICLQYYFQSTNEQPLEHHLHDHLRMMYNQKLSEAKLLFI